MWYCYCKTCRTQEKDKDDTSEEIVPTDQELLQEGNMDSDGIEDVPTESSQAQPNGEGLGEDDAVDRRVQEDHESTFNGAEET